MITSQNEHGLTLLLPNDEARDLWDALEFAIANGRDIGLVDSDFEAHRSRWKLLADQLTTAPLFRGETV